MIRAAYARWVEQQRSKEPFTKAQGYYVSRSLTPAACANCPWFTPPERCVIVTAEGPPSPGRILPEGICGLYAATPLRIRAYEAAYGRGAASKGVLPHVVRSRVEAARWSLDPEVVP